VEYKLTELGQSMRTLFDALWAWGEHYQEVVAQS
jgi:transcriptional regulator, MarR family